MTGTEHTGIEPALVNDDVAGNVDHSLGILNPTVLPRLDHEVSATYTTRRIGAP